jgi:outer membrane protein TolC
MSNDECRKNDEFSMTNYQTRLFGLRLWVFVILSSFFIWNLSSGARLLAAPPALLSVSETQPLDEPGPPPRSAPSEKVYPLPVGPILKKLPKIRNIQENLAQAGPAVAPADQESMIDLDTALRLAERDNPGIAIGRQAIQEALAKQLQAQVLGLPTLRAGLNYHLHDGVLQTSSGEIRHIDETSLYFGGGARALAAETVAFPAVQFFSHLGDAFFEPLAARQQTSATRARAEALANNILLETSARFLDLMRAEGELATLVQSEKDMNLIVQTTAAFFKTGLGRDADARRARTEGLLLHTRKQGAEERLAVAAAELARVLDLDPSVRLRTPAKDIALVELVDQRLSVEQLLSIAVSSRPELAALQADIARAQIQLRQERFRPFLPTISVAYSAGGFGGGTNRTDLVPIHPEFGRIGARTDFDVIAYWTLQNMGFGNRAVQNQRQAERNLVQIEQVRMLNQVRREVADALALTQTRRRQLNVAQMRLQAAENGFRFDYLHVRARRGLPIEVLNSMDRLADARVEFVAALAEFNKAQFRLFVALGQNPMAAGGNQ